jgi:hypothetical protein
VTPDDLKNLQAQLVALEADHGERIAAAMAIHARNLADWIEAVETGRPVGRFVAADEMSPAEAAELVAVGRAFPFVDPRRWGSHDIPTELDG